MNTGITVSLWRRWIALLLTAVTLFGLAAPAGYAENLTTDDSKAAAPTDALHMPEGEAACADTACSEAGTVPEIGGISYTVEFHYAGRDYVLPGDGARSRTPPSATRRFSLPRGTGRTGPGLSAPCISSIRRNGCASSWTDRSMRSP